MLRRFLYHGFIVDNSQCSPEVRNGEFIAWVKGLVEELWSDIFKTFKF